MPPKTESLYFTFLPVIKSVVKRSIKCTSVLLCVSYNECHTSDAGSLEVWAALVMLLAAEVTGATLASSEHLTTAARTAA